MPTPRSLSLVQMARVEHPCPVADNLFAGAAAPGESTRFCGHCQLHVHDLSALSASEGDALIRSRAARSERLCIAFTPDRHGAPISADRPLALARRRAGVALSRWLGARAAALGLTAFGAALLAGCGRSLGNMCVPRLHDTSGASPVTEPAPQPTPQDSSTTAQPAPSNPQ